MPDPDATRLNEQNLSVYRSAFEQGILEGIVVARGEPHCEAVERYADRYDLWEVPEFPVGGCDNAEDCNCGYQAQFKSDIQVHRR